MVRPLPLGPETFGGEGIAFTIPGRDRGSTREELEADLRFVSPEYFRAMGIPLLAGRDFTERDDRPPSDASAGWSGVVVIVSRSAVERYWSGDDPTGSRIRIGNGEVEIVGMVGQVRQTALAETPGPAIYVSHRQVSRRGMTIVVRGADPAGLAGPVQRVIWDLRPDQPIENVASLAAVVSGSLARPRFATTLLSVFAALALALASVGVYGVTRAMEGLLYGIQPLDAWSFAVASLLLLGVAAAGAAIPAARACRVDPLAVIRDE